MNFSFKKTWTVAWKDYKAYFTSPIAYIVIAIFLVIMGWMFYFNLLMFFRQGMQFKQFGQGKPASISEGIIRPLYGNLNVIFLFLIPAITMRLFSEEKKMQTIQLLMTSPIRLSEMIIGKFLSALGLMLTMLGITLLYPVVLFLVGNPEFGPIFSSYLGTILLASCYISMGVLFSAMTENQIVAFFLTFGAGLFLWLINWAAQSAGPVLGDFLDYLSLIQHYSNFSSGIIDSTDVIFYGSFIGLGLFLTHRVLDSYRWR